MTNHTTSILPAYIWTGPHDATIEHTITYLQEQLCPAHGCTACPTCLQIRSQQHHATTWLAPDKHYSLEDIAIIFKTISFSLEPGQHHFFIIEKADCLTPACANSLLKSIEEPPAGYHFLLLTERPDQLLPTIKSRCITHTLHAPKQYTAHAELFSCFASQNGPDAGDFLKLLDQSKIDERESLELLDQLLSHWTTIYKTKLTSSQSTAKAVEVITILKKHYEQLPMPGSSKLFWRNMFLQIHAG